MSALQFFRLGGIRSSLAFSSATCFEPLGRGRWFHFFNDARLVWRVIVVILFRESSDTLFLLLKNFPSRRRASRISLQEFSWVKPVFRVGRMTPCQSYFEAQPQHPQKIREARPPPTNREYPAMVDSGRCASHHSVSISHLGWRWPVGN